MIPVWLPVAVPWAGAALLAALPRRPAFLGPAVALASFAAAVALALGGGEGRSPEALGVALMLAGAAAALLVAVWNAGTAPEGEGRFAAAGFPLLQGAQALALLAGDAVVAWIGLAIGIGAGVSLVAVAGGGRPRRAFAAAWRMLLACGAGLSLALLGVALLHGGATPPSTLANLGFVLVLVGHGALAGLAPLGAWLPRAAAVAAPPVVALVAGLLPPAALHAILRAMEKAGPASGVLPASALLLAVGLATAGLAAAAAWRLPARAAARSAPGRGAAALAGLAAVGFGLGGAAGVSAGILLMLGLPFCVGAAALGGAAGGPVLAALGRLSLAGMPPFVPFVALLTLFSAVAALPAGAALPLGAALLAAGAAQLAAVGRHGGGGDAARGEGGALLAGPVWAFLGLAIALGAALPEALATALAGAAAGFAR